jgi:hypothetical protein
MRLRFESMKSLGLFISALVVILAFPGMAGARVVRLWSDQELFEKSDLVVIATPVATGDTKERGSHPSRADQPIIGVETKFAVSAVLKGDPAIKHFVLHHYRPDKIKVINAPTFISFDLEKKRIFHLFLIRQSDGRYAPVAGQYDPENSIKEEGSRQPQ